MPSKAAPAAPVLIRSRREILFFVVTNILPRVGPFRIADCFPPAAVQMWNRQR
jgi:hypothetical protein